MYSVPKFILFGDSITQHANDQVSFALAPALQSRYARKLDVVTRGFSGYNTNHAAVVFPEVLRAEHANTGIIKLVLIFLGTNDAAFTFQGVPVEVYRANLLEMVRLALSYNIRVIVVGPTLHGRAEHHKAKALQNSDIFSDIVSTRKYADAAALVAAEHRVPFIDLWTAFQRHGGWSTDELLQGNVPVGDLLPDGVHFSPAAYNIFYDEMVATIGQNYPELEPSAMHFYFPEFDKMDSSNLEQSVLAYMEEHWDKQSE